VEKYRTQAEYEDAVVEALAALLVARWNRVHSEQKRRNVDSDLGGHCRLQDPHGRVQYEAT
jgi:hypothetical protein